MAPMPGPRELIVVGGGGHARVVIEAARTRPDLWNVTGFIDPADCSDTVERMGIKRIGEDEAQVAEEARRGECLFVVGVGSTADSGYRREIVNRCALAPERWAAVIHSTAWVAPTAVIEPGAVVLAQANVNSGAKVSAHAIINTSAIVEYDASIGAFTHVCPAAAVGARAKVGEGAYLGIGCRIRDRVKIGRDVTVGMGSVVLNSIPDGRVVIGIPAKDMHRDTEQG